MQLCIPQSKISCNNVRVYKAQKLGRIVACSHIEQAVCIGYYAVSAVVHKRSICSACSVFQSAVDLIAKGVGYITAYVGYSNRRASVVEVVGLVYTCSLLTYQSSAVDVLRHYAVLFSYKKP